MRNEDDFYDDEDYSQCADCDTVGHDPKELVSTTVLLHMFSLLDILTISEVADWAYQGVPNPMRSCIAMNCALIPNIVPAVTSMTIVQRFSCRSGQ